MSGSADTANAPPMILAWQTLLWRSHEAVFEAEAVWPCSLDQHAP
ncbi:hypothetical protein [Caballeronia sp. KNU42]